MNPGEKITLWPKPFCNGSPEPELWAYVLEDGKEHPVLLVIPGGGYSQVCNSYEGHDIALRYNQMGMHAFVLTYRVAPRRYPEPQQDALRAIRVIRSHAAEWHILQDQLAVLGFSAGGHLCACTGTRMGEVNADAGDAIDAIDGHPNALILCYAVLSEHVGSMENLQGETFHGYTDQFSADKQVYEKTPPTFLWHTVTDGCVPVHNSIDFFESMHAWHKPVEMHLFPRGDHGLGMALDYPDVKQWVELSRTFLRETAHFAI